MSIDVTKLTGDRALHILMIPPPIIPDETIQIHQTVSAFKKEMGGHIYRILDFTNLPLGFSELMMGMAADLNEDGGINDLTISTIYIGSGEWVAFGAKAFQEQSQYGQTNVKHVCLNLDEALKFIREQKAS